VPILIVAYLDMISGFKGVILLGSKLSRVCLARCFWESQAYYYRSIISSFVRLMSLNSDWGNALLIVVYSTIYLKNLLPNN
jgi:hypothetical protein